MLWMGMYCNVLVRKKTWGVSVSDDFKWEKQCCEAVKKANRILGMIKRNFTDRSQSTLIPLYKSCQNPQFRKILS